MVKIDRLYIDESDRDLYDQIRKEIFNNEEKENKDLFLIALSIGFKNNFRLPIEKKFGFIRREYLNDEDLSLIESLAIYSSENIEILTNEVEVFKIAEEYAHGGVKILIDKIKSSPLGAFDKKFETELVDLYEKLQLGNENTIS